MECDSRIIAVEVAVLNEIFDGIDELFFSSETLATGGECGIPS